MLGLCCPTPDGAMLACCDALLGGEKRMQEEWRSLIYVDHAGMCDRDTNIINFTLLMLLTFVLLHFIPCFYSPSKFVSRNVCVLIDRGARIFPNL